LPLALGHVDFADGSIWRRTGVIVADTLAEVRAAIDSAGAKYEIVLVQEAHKSHNVVRYLGRFWGLPQALGQVNLADEADQRRPGVIVADTLAEARRAIDYVGRKDEIVLVQEGYKAHNIVRYRGRYWGLPKILGQVNLEDEADRQRPGAIVADTLAKVRKAIDAVGRKYEIVLVKEGYKQHNIVRYRARFWGLPKALGPVNIEDEAEWKRPGVIVADTLAEVRAAIDGASPRYKMALVQQGYKAHNIVRYRGRFWGLPMALGHMNLAYKADRQRPGVIVADSLPDILTAIDNGQD